MKKKISKAFTIIFFAAALFYPFNIHASPPGKISSGRAIVSNKKCARCHNLTGSPVTAVEDILKKKGPDLFFAGNKFKKSFLVSFLQKPVTIRPAGTVYLNHVNYNGFKDELSEVLPCESSLSESDAYDVAAFLLSLKVSFSEGDYKPKPFSVARARIIFEKNLACHGCHRVRGDKGEIEGGVSGTVLYNAGNRLRGAWVYSFLKNPQKWIPGIWMPTMPDNKEHLQLITDYVMSMVE